MPPDSENNFSGIDIAAKTMRDVAISAAGEVLGAQDAAYRPEDLISVTRNLVAGLGELGPFKSVGIAIPGLVNRETDRVLISTGLPSMVRDDLHSELMKATRLSVELDNDANAAAYGEYKPCTWRDWRRLFDVGVGDAIGGAIILDGNLWIGAS